MYHRTKIGADLRNGSGVSSRVRRFDGILSETDKEECRRTGIELAFDPVQQGWVVADCIDDRVPEIDATGLDYPQSSDRYMFRAWRPSDADRLAEMLSSEALWRYLPEDYAGPVDQAAAVDLIDLANNLKTHTVRAVELRDRVIGQVRLVFAGEDDAELSYWLDGAVWGQGHGHRIVSRYVDEAYREHPKLQRLHARVHADNPASARILTRAGFSENPARTASPWHIYEHRRAG